MLLSVCQTGASEVGSALKPGGAGSSGCIPSTALACLKACVLLLSSASPSRCVPLDCPVPFHVLRVFRYLQVGTNLLLLLLCGERGSQVFGQLQVEAGTKTGFRKCLYHWRFSEHLDKLGL